MPIWKLILCRHNSAVTSHFLLKKTQQKHLKRATCTYVIKHHDCRSLPSISFSKTSVGALFVFHPLVPHSPSSSPWRGCWLYQVLLLFDSGHWWPLSCVSPSAATLPGKDRHLLGNHFSSIPTSYSHRFTSDLFTYLHPTRWRKVFSDQYSGASARPC